MFVRLALALVIAGTTVAAQEQDKPKVPKDSLMATIVGCLKGRVIRASDVKQTDTTSGYTVHGRSFRVNGKKDIIELVKDNDGRQVELTGLIKKSALIEPGIKFKGGRVMVGGGMSGGGMSSRPDPAENVVSIDTMTVTPLGGSCGS